MLLSELAPHHGAARLAKSTTRDDTQFSLFIDPAPGLLKALEAAKVDEITPVQAFDLLREWQKKFGR